MKAIESIEEWDALAAKLSEHGYTLWVMQYGTDRPEGFHARFFKAGKTISYEVVTYNDAVHDAIVKYRPK